MNTQSPEHLLAEVPAIEKQSVHKPKIAHMHVGMTLPHSNNFSFNAAHSDLLCNKSNPIDYASSETKSNTAR